MPVIVISSDRFEDHLTPPGHPECVERAEVMQVVAGKWRDEGGRVESPRSATPDELQRVHTETYLEAIERTAGRAVALDPDTYTSPASYDIALLAAGAALQGVELVLNGEGGRRVFCLVRPPGHHAEANRAMGFCLFSNAAAAAAHALARGLSRVAVVDYDVHHGNGTQQIFYDDPRVLYVSTHQFPYYPGTGRESEVGRNRGEGFTFNIPLEAGATDADYALVFETLVVPVLRQFRPELIIVSAGFDAHARDPLGGMRMTTQGFERLNQDLCAVADAHCQGRVVAITEGGYDLKTLAECLMATLEVFDGRRTRRSMHSDGPTSRATAALAAVTAAQRRCWQL